MKRMRYQQGTLLLEERENGMRVWEYRWYETQIGGSRRRRSAMIGTIDEFPKESVAQKAVAALEPTSTLQPLADNWTRLALGF